MTKYQEELRKELLSIVKFRCKKCSNKMIEIIDIYDESIQGWSCVNCEHYVLDRVPHIF